MVRFIMLSGYMLGIVEMIFIAIVLLGLSVSSQASLTSTSGISPVGSAAATALDKVVPSMVRNNASEHSLVATPRTPLNGHNPSEPPPETVAWLNMQDKNP
jgi:hypothetical protein